MIAFIIIVIIVVIFCCVFHTPKNTIRYDEESFQRKQTTKKSVHWGTPIADYKIIPAREI